MSDPDEFILFLVRRIIDQAKSSYPLYVAEAAQSKDGLTLSEIEYVKNASLGYLANAQDIIRNQATFEEDVERRNLLMEEAMHLGSIYQIIFQLDLESFNVFITVNGADSTDIYGNLQSSQSELFR